MTTSKIATAALATLLAGGAAVAAAPAASSATVYANHVSTMTVLDGKISGLMGNQHQLSFQTATEGSSWPARQARISSYYCPSGAKVTSGWASSRCVLRSKTYFSYDRSDVRVSSTMRSATYRGTFRTATKSFPVDLRWYGVGQVDVSPYGPGAQIRADIAQVYGSIGTATVRPGERTNSSIHRLERI